MSAHSKHSLLGLGALALGLALTGCGGDDSDDSSGGSSAAGDFAEAIPGDDELALTLDDGDGQAALTQGLTGQPSRLRDLTRDVFEQVNDLRHAAHAKVQALVEGVEPTTVTEGALTCKRWETDEAAVHWRLTSCQKDKKNRHYAFALKGRPVDASDDALLVVLAGEGKVKARFDGKKRGHGRVGFDFDNLASLTGQEGPAGKVGIGFRAVGRMRQLNVGLRDFARAGDDTPITALYRFQHIVEVGGRVTLLAHGDIVSKNDADELVSGEDGQTELVRAAVAWNRGRGARAVAAVCGGTVGEGTCERVVQCWRADGQVSQESVEPSDDADAMGPGRGHGRIDWEPAACPGHAAGLDDLEDAPEESDFLPPAGEDLPEEPGAGAGEKG